MRLTVGGVLVNIRFYLDKREKTKKRLVFLQSFGIQTWVTKSDLTR